MTCRHIYEYVNQDPCPDCGGHTHEIDWKSQWQAYLEWITSGKANSQGWWSI